MSAIKAFELDLHTARRRAVEAAGRPTAPDRMRDLTAVFEAVGESARSYADPHTVARVLVREAARAYRGALKAAKVVTR